MTTMMTMMLARGVGHSIGHAVLGPSGVCVCVSRMRNFSFWADGGHMLPMSPSRVGVLVRPTGSGERKDGGVCGARKRMVYRRDGAGV